MSRRSLSLLAVAVAVLVAWLALRSERGSVQPAVPRASASATEAVREPSALDDELSRATPDERTDAARELERPDASITIRGRVVDAQKQPIETFGLRVIHRDADNWLIGVDERPPERHERGEFELAELASGRWEVVPFADGYSLRTSPGAMTKTFEQRFDYVMRGVASFAGIVLDPDGNPVAEADVEVLGRARSRHPHDEESDEFVGVGVQRVRTAANGTFWMEVESGTHELMARAEGWVESDRLRIGLRPSETREGLELVLHRGATLIASVLDVHGERVRGGSLRCGETSHGLDERGQVMVTALAAGTLELGFQTPEGTRDGGSYAGRVELRADQTREVTLRLAARRPVHVTGRLVIPARVLLIGEAHVEFDVVPEPDDGWLVPDDELKVRTGPAGQFEFVAPAPGKYAAWFVPKEYVKSGALLDVDPDLLVRRFEIGGRDVFDLVIER